MHLSRKCKTKETTISKVKAHIKIEHVSEIYLMIDHLKTSRDDHTEVTRRDF